MSFFNASELNNSTISFIGISKNAGKTTAFNCMLKECFEAGIVPGITSIGRDGERTDIVTKTEKPEIFIKKGTYFATASKLLSKSDVTKKIFDSTVINTPLGEVYIAKAESSGFAEIGGPSIVSQLNMVKEKLFGLGAETVLIDGAADRRSLGTSAVADKVVLCTGAAFSKDMEETVEYTAFIAELFGLPVIDCNKDLMAMQTKDSEGVTDFLTDGIYLAGDYIRKEGAVLDSSVEKLLRTMNESGRRKLVFDDPSKILLTFKSFKRLKMTGAEMFFERKPELLCVAMNPVSPYGYEYNEEKFRQRLKDCINVPVINVGRP